MKYLLDTHAFLWWIGDDRRLSEAARDAISRAENELFFSVASAWEIAIKTQLGRLTLTTSLDKFLTEQIRRNDLDILPIGLYHAITLHGLPLHHRDPFDRMLVAQAIAEELTLISRDELIRQYDVPVRW